jgi:hypothetical protein
MLTRLAESSGRPLERHGNVSRREMTVHGAHAPGQNPAYRPTHSPRACTPPREDYSVTTEIDSGTATASEAAPMMPALLR